MKIAIHHRQSSFSDYWIEYCKANNIDYKIVNAFDNNIIEKIQDCDVFMWHHHHANFEDTIVAKKILFALEHTGIKVFPDFKTGWHFDDKVAQKYLLESIKAPLVPSYVFYDKKQALEWAKQTDYPKVFKLKGGAGALNVKLVKDFAECKKFIKAAFGKGFSQFDKINYLKDKGKNFIKGKESFIAVFKGIYRLFILPEFARKQPREINYVYFQEFIPNNFYDTRVVVIGGKVAAAERRFVRKNDFRASGSGEFSYENIDLEIIKLSFEVAKKLNLQSVAFDFIYDLNQNPLIIEISYGFGVGGINNVPGYWDDHLNWHEDIFNAEEKIIIGLINS
ncbi:ATP-grasp domain-containing protein [Acinetobacter indicus]|uniref:ATP-grasp domain-containing protein n=1 Tax=Acinetobacter indicus TaxID=756892 RepID=UPI002576609A|nr:hypothetical protein [Acinetobacter indicus]MDM1286212.1 hypothetical protein [Acinetobacter indicus]